MDYTRSNHDAAGSIRKFHYSLDNNRKYLKETYNLEEDFLFECKHEFEDFKINFKQKCDKCYRFHVTELRITCKKENCNISLCRKCALEFFNHRIREEEFIRNRPDDEELLRNNDKRIISQLLKRIEDLERQLEDREKENKELKQRFNKGKMVISEEEHDRIGIEELLEDAKPFTV